LAGGDYDVSDVQCQLRLLAKQQQQQQQQQQQGVLHVQCRALAVAWCSRGDFDVSDTD
jgi:hypothetical protein